MRHRCSREIWSKTKSAVNGCFWYRRLRSWMFIQKVQPAWKDVVAGTQMCITALLRRGNENCEFSYGRQSSIFDLHLALSYRWYSCRAMFEMLPSKQASMRTWSVCCQHSKWYWRNFENLHDFSSGSNKHTLVHLIEEIGDTSLWKISTTYDLLKYLSTLIYS